MGKIGRVDSATGRIREYLLPGEAKDPHTLIIHGGGVWFTAPQSNRYGRLDPRTGEVRVYTAETLDAGPYDIAAAPDGSLWITLSNTNRLGRIRPETGELEEVVLPEPRARPIQLGIDADGRIWYADRERSKLAVLDPEIGQVREFSTASERALPRSVAIGPDGRIWYYEERTNLLVGFHPVREETEVIPILTSGSVVWRIARDYARRELWAALGGGALGRLSFGGSKPGP